jgi:hypothetical protein
VPAGHTLRRRTLRAAPWAALLPAVLVAAAPVGAQRSGGATAGFQEAFVLRRGDDTIAVERFTRSGAELRGEITLRGSGRVAYRGALAPGALVREITFRQLPAAGVNGLSTSSVLTFRGAAVTVTLRESNARRAEPTRTVPTERGAVPFANPSFALSEQIVRRARALHPPARRPLATTASPAEPRPADTVRVPVFAVAGGETLQAAVVWVGADSVALTLGGVEVRARVDPAGALRGAAVPSQGLIVERVAAAALRRPTAVRPTRPAPSTSVPPR